MGQSPFQIQNRGGGISKRGGLKNYEGEFQRLEEKKGPPEIFEEQKKIQFFFLGGESPPVASQLEADFKLLGRIHSPQPFCDPCLYIILCCSVKKIL
jgi:hypothetical protein